MSDGKYYWLKLKKDFFKRHDIMVVESMQNGKDYVLFYLKLLLESIDHNGSLRFSETIPYNESMLSTVTNTNIDIVRSAMKVFIELGLVDVLDDETIFMNETQKMLGAETEWAEKKREYRKKLLMQTAESLDVKGKEQNVEQKKQTRKRISCKVDESEGIFSDQRVIDAFNEYIKHRKLKRAPMTEEAIVRQKNNVKKIAGDNAELAKETIEYAIDKGWTGIYPIPKERAKNEESWYNDWRNG